MSSGDEPYSIRLLPLVALSAAGVFSVANHGALATDGILFVTYILIAALGVLLPCVLVTAEPGSRIQMDGGVFDWVSAGPGQRWALAAALIITGYATGPFRKGIDSMRILPHPLPHEIC